MADNNKYDFDTMTISMDGNRLCECAIVRYFVANNRNYIALLEIDENGEAAADDFYLYRCELSDNNEPILSNIETEEEYEIVAEAFDEEMDAMEYEEIYGEEDSEE